MGKGNYAVKLDSEFMKTLKGFCKEKGYKQSSFVEKALWEQMEREEMKDDIFDLVHLRSLESLARPLPEYERSRK